MLSTSHSTAHYSTIQQIMGHVHLQIVSIFVLLQNAAAVCSGVDPAMFTQEDADQYRNVVFSHLRTSVVSNSCAHPNCKQGARNVNWVACDNCLLWFHTRCVQLTSTILDTATWLCFMCEPHVHPRE